jgi:hypothetical protein
MIWKRRLVTGALAAGLCAGLQVARAQDPPPPAEGEAATPAEPPKKKEPFFGDRFAMYLETRGGSADIDTIEAPVSVGSQANSTSDLDFDGSKTGQFTIGWTLPRGRGQ